MLNLTRWQRPELTTWGFGRLTNLQDEIEQLFDAPFSGLTQTADGFNGWTPAMDVYEEPDHYVVRTEVPGLKKEDIEVSLRDGNLTISGERKGETMHKEAKVYRTERYFGRFQRTVSFGAPVAADKVKADYKDGVLTVTLPKTEEAKPKQIDVSVN